MKGRTLFLLVVAIGVLLDLFSKHIVFQSLDGYGKESIPPSVDVIPVLFSIRCVSNKGGIWGWWQEYSDLLLVLRFAALFIILYLFYLTDPKKRFFMIALGLILAGALGNLLDSIFLGYVRDFLDFGLQEHRHRWPTFNFADAFISIGVGLGILQFVLDWHRRKKSPGRETKGEG